MGRDGLRLHGRDAVAADLGAGLLSTAISVLVFLSLMLLSVQIVFALYATSTLTAAAWDAVRIASGSDAAADPAAARVDAEAHLRRMLGDYGNRVTVEWVDEPGAVVLSVSAEHPSFLPGPLRRSIGLDRVERTVRLREERVH